MVAEFAKKYNKTPRLKKENPENLLLTSLIKLNAFKQAALCTVIKVAQAKAMITRKLRRNSRLYKIYWVINTKNRHYKLTKERYSAGDIYLMCMDLLRRDNEREVSKRTIQKDIKLLNQMGLLKTVTLRFGKDNGSASYYVQNMELASKHKQIIDTYLEEEIIGELRDKIIIGDFDEHIARIKFNTDTSIDSSKDNNNKDSKDTSKSCNKKPVLKQKKCIKSKSRQATSHQKVPDVINLNNNYNNKNSIEVPLEKSKSKREVNPETYKEGICKRLISKYKISSVYIEKIMKISPNETTYINALLNLETAIKQYLGEYKIEHITAHFKEQFKNKYRNKIWMMMDRKDGVVSDYYIIWELRFKDKYESKKQIRKQKQKVEESKIKTEEQKQDIRSNIFSILLNRLKNGTCRQYLADQSTNELRKKIRQYVNEIGDGISYRGILNNSYYYNLLDRFKKKKGAPQQTMVRGFKNTTPAVTQGHTNFRNSCSRGSMNTSWEVR
ncbi:plasmid maintenance protein [Borrelia sp. P9F1]|uniref:plasmid maintenance protein n=1 Tax=Borrelia sp. P9F1 TaxID=3058374 RepID=UPI0026471D83|nr:plasmid maintenance protein [Borrelia sp. P9F1]WKC58518.1 plasmid maintenance protein [Borrelia sp. P9F1]